MKDKQTSYPNGNYLFKFLFVLGFFFLKNVSKEKTYLKKQKTTTEEWMVRVFTRVSTQD